MVCLCLWCSGYGHAAGMLYAEFLHSLWSAVKWLRCSLFEWSAALGLCRSICTDAAPLLSHTAAVRSLVLCCWCAQCCHAVDCAVVLCLVSALLWCNVAERRLSLLHLTVLFALWCCGAIHMPAAFDAALCSVWCSAMLSVLPKRCRGILCCGMCHWLLCTCTAALLICLRCTAVGLDNCAGPAGDLAKLFSTFPWEEGTVCSGGSDPLRTALRSRAQDRAHNTCKGEYGHIGTQPCGTIFARRQEERCRGSTCL